MTREEKYEHKKEIVEEYSGRLKDLIIGTTELGGEDTTKILKNIDCIKHLIMNREDL